MSTPRRRRLFLWDLVPLAASVGHDPRVSTPAAHPIHVAFTLPSKHVNTHLADLRALRARFGTGGFRKRGTPGRQQRHNDKTRVAILSTPEKLGQLSTPELDLVCGLRYFWRDHEADRSRRI